MIGIIRQAKNDYYEASDSVLQIGHLLGHNVVRREFHSKSSKMSLWWSAAKHFLKRMFPRRLTVVCKLVMDSFVTRFNKKFKVRAQNVGLMKGTRKLREYEDWDACDSTWQTSHLFGGNRVQGDFYREGPKSTLWW